MINFIKQNPLTTLVILGLIVCLFSTSIVVLHIAIAVVIIYTLIMAILNHITNKAFATMSKLFKNL